MNRPRVALVLGTSTGGVGVHVRSLARALGEQGWPVTVCAPASTLHRFDFGAARIEPVPIRRAGLEALAVPALRRATRDAGLVHAHGLRAGTAAVLAGRRPLVVTWHNAVLAHGLRSRVLARGEQLVARRADVNLAASADLAARIRGLGGSAQLAPVAAPQPRPTRTAAQVRGDLDVPVDSPLVLGVGRLHGQKRHDVLIRAAARFSTRTPAPVFAIAGDGPLQAELSELVRATGAPVRLLGHRDDVADLAAAADVVVSTSQWEARPLVVQEAMILGRAVIATDVGGVAGLVGDAAVLVDAGDVEAVVGAVAALLDSPAARAELGRRAAVQAATWPDEADTVRACVDVYHRLLG